MRSTSHRCTTASTSDDAPQLDPTETGPRPIVARVAVRAPTAAAVLLRTLAQRGVRTAFGIPGGTISPVFDALADVPEITYIATRHEAIAAFAAMGHARVTGQPALVLTTSGPGVTNALTGIASASLEELPLVLVGGEVPIGTAGRGGLQDGSSAGLDLHASLRSVIRWSGTLASPSNAAGVAARAFMAATGPRPGPVFVSVPLDVGGAPSAEPRIAGPSSPTPAPDPDACRAAAALLAGARRPLLVLGNGARRAAHEARVLAERASIPVVVTAHAKGVFPETSALYLGIVGAGGHPSVDEHLADPPDVTCVVGSRLGDLATNGWSVDVSGTRATIHVDRDPSLVGRNARASLAVIGDAAAVLRAMIAALPADLGPPRGAIRPCRSLRPELAQSSAVPLKPQRVLAALSRAFPDATWCVDVGEHLTMAQHYLRVESPDRYHSMAGLGSMGSGIGAAIGVKAARPGATVIALAGDGGFAMHAGELLSCVEAGLGVIFAVFNDGRWGMVDHGFRAVYGRAPSGLPRHVADLRVIAEGFGAAGARIEWPEDLDRDRLRALAATRRPLVLDVRIDPEESLSTETRSAALRHFTSRNA